MHGIFAYIWLTFMVNVGRYTWYTIHGSYGQEGSQATSPTANHWQIIHRFSHGKFLFYKWDLSLSLSFTCPVKHESESLWIITVLHVLKPTRGPLHVLGGNAWCLEILSPVLSTNHRASLEEYSLLAISPSGERSTLPYPSADSQSDWGYCGGVQSQQWKIACEIGSHTGIS